MATIARCDPAKPMYVAAYVDRLSDEPDFVALAKQHGDDTLRCVAMPLGETLTIAPTDTAALLTAIQSSPWQGIFENALQHLAATTAGEDLLTALMTRDDAEAMLRHIVANGGDSTHAAAAIVDTIHRWADEANGPFTVAIDAHEVA